MFEPTHLKKYDRQIGSFPQIGMNIKKHFKPPPSGGLLLFPVFLERVSGLVFGRNFQIRNTSPGSPSTIFNRVGLRTTTFYNKALSSSKRSPPFVQIVVDLPRYIKRMRILNCHSVLVLRKVSLREEWKWDQVHPWRSTWNIIMEAWKSIFLSKRVICRFHVNLPGCTLQGFDVWHKES